MNGIIFTIVYYSFKKAELEIFFLHVTIISDKKNILVRKQYSYLFLIIMYSQYYTKHSDTGRRNMRNIIIAVSVASTWFTFKNNTRSSHNFSSIAS